MDLVLAVLILGVAEVTVLSLALRAFERAEDRRERAGLPARARVSQAGSRFFADAPVAGPSDRASIEALVGRLERHIRIEQAAAESFLHNPTPESLHHRASSPLHLAN